MTSSNNECGRPSNKDHIDMSTAFDNINCQVLVNILKDIIIDEDKLWIIYFLVRGTTEWIPLAYNCHSETMFLIWWIGFHKKKVVVEWGDTFYSLVEWWDDKYKMNTHFFFPFLVEKRGH